MYLGQVESALDHLAYQIIEVCTLNETRQTVLLPINSLRETWEASDYRQITGLDGLSDNDCVYIATKIRQYFEMAQPGTPEATQIEHEIFLVIKDIIGAKQGSIFSLINVGLVGIFAFIGYKIINRKR
jgi:hypothetical protein